MVVPPTNGQSQPTQINVPATIAYKYPPFSPPEEGAWVMPPYLEIFPPANPGPLLPLFIMGRNMPGAVAYPTVIEPDVAWLPPPVQTTEMFRGNQGWPL